MLFTPAFVADPYPTYAALREQAAAHLVRLPGGIDAWLVTRYEEAKQVFLDNTRFSKVMAGHWRAFDEERVPLNGDVMIGLGDSMLVSDPPRHTRLRSLVAKVFTARRIDALEPRVRRTADELLDAIVARRAGEADLVEDFARLLPMSVICELLGVPQADSEALRLPVETIMSNDERGQQDAFEAFQTVHGYLAGLVVRKRGSGDDDLTAALTEVHDEGGGRLSTEELVGMLALLVSAGHETTVNLLGNTVLALVRHPEQLARVRETGDWAEAVEEVLRWDGSIQNAIWRFTVEDVMIGDVKIPAGEAVAVCVAAADRDGGRFPAGERFDVGGAHRGHLAFGHGIHHCLGAPLARLEARTAVPMVFDRLPGLRVTGEPAYRPSTVSRALASLPVGFQG